MNYMLKASVLTLSGVIAVPIFCDTSEINLLKSYREQLDDLHTFRIASPDSGDDRKRVGYVTGVRAPKNVFAAGIDLGLGVDQAVLAYKEEDYLGAFIESTKAVGSAAASLLGVDRDTVDWLFDDNRDGSLVNILADSPPFNWIGKSLYELVSGKDLDELKGESVQALEQLVRDQNARDILLNELGDQSVDIQGVEKRLNSLKESYAKPSTSIVSSATNLLIPERLEDGSVAVKPKTPDEIIEKIVGVWKGVHNFQPKNSGHARKFVIAYVFEPSGGFAYQANVTTGVVGRQHMADGQWSVTSDGRLYLEYEFTRGRIKSLVPLGNRPSDDDLGPYNESVNLSVKHLGEKFLLLDLPPSLLKLDRDHHVHYLRRQESHYND